jgi:propanol-preferring alcohol dehydrogenase
MILTDALNTREASTDMHAMVLQRPGSRLNWLELPTPEPTGHEVLLTVDACAVCRTDLHVADGELPDIHYPIIPGHQVVGHVLRAGELAKLAPGTRVGVAWLGWTCQACDYCDNGRENLCDSAVFNGYQHNGGFADHMLADARYVFPLDDQPAAEEIAPLLCGGLIGYRSLKMAGPGRKLGIYGFGSAAHLITQLAVYQGWDVYAFTRPGDTQAIQLAESCGVCRAAGSDQPTPAELDAGIIFAPVGALVPKALKDIRKGGKVVCGGIHMSDIPAFPYADLWGERSIASVANMTRADGREFLALATEAAIKPRIETWSLQEANTALRRLKDGAVSGTAVLLP